MERRKFLIGVGALGAGASAALGTGAFTTVQANRSVNVATAGDASSYLRLLPAETPNGRQYASFDEDDTLQITLDRVNDDAVTTVENVFTIQNAGTQPVSVYITDGSDAVTFEADGSSVESAADAVRLGVGDDASVSLTIDTTGDTSGQLLTDVTVVARSQVAARGDVNTLSVGPASFGTDFETIQGAIDAIDAGDATADTLLLEDATFSEEIVTVSVDGLTIRAVSGASPTVTSPDGVKTVFDITADGVTIEGLTITNPVGSNTGFSFNQCVSVGSSITGLAIVDNDFVDVGTGESARGNTEPVSLSADPDVTITDVRIVGNRFETLRSEFNTDVGFGNRYPKAIYASSIPGGNQEEPGRIENLTIRNNLIRDVEGPNAAFGVQLHGLVTGVEITGNNIREIRGDPTGEVTPEDSPTDPDGNPKDPGFDFASAIQIGNDRGGPVSDVQIEGNYLRADSHPTPASAVDDPSTLDNAATPGFGVVVEADTDASSVVARDNSIEADGGVINKTGNGIVDARANWWGDPSGPSSAGEDPNAPYDSAGSAVADGSGALVVDWNNDGTAEVDFDDHRTEPLVSETLRVGPDGAFDTVQAALDAADPSDEIVVDTDITGGFRIDTPDVTLRSGTGSRPTIDGAGEQTRLDAPGVSVIGFDIDLTDGGVFYANSGAGLRFRDNDVSMGPTTEHGIRIEASAVDGPADVVVEGNRFEQAPVPDDSGLTPQGVLLSGGTGYTVRNNTFVGESSGQAVLLTSKGADAGAEILNNTVSGWANGVFLFENDREVGVTSVVGNDISDTSDTGIVAFDATGSDSFDELNGATSASEQEAALSEDNVVDSVDVTTG